MSENKHRNILLAGAFAAFSVDLLVYPLDTLKTRFQSPHYQSIYYDSSNHAMKRGLLFKGLYQGIGSVILITIPSSAAFFTTYEGLKSFLLTTSPLLPQPLIDSTSSSIAELVSCLILTPAEVLKQNAQMVRRPPDSACKNTIYRASTSLQVLQDFSRKPSQLFRGYTTLAARNLPFTAMQFPMFEHLKQTIRVRRKANGTATGSLLETSLVTATSAGMAGSVAAVLTTPSDVVKTRIMLSAAGDNNGRKFNGGPGMKRVEGAKSKRVHVSARTFARMEGDTRKGSFGIAKEIYKEGGVKGLFRGGALRGAWTGLGSALYLGAYESGRVWLGDPYTYN